MLPFTRLNQAQAMNTNQVHILHLTMSSVSQMFPGRAILPTPVEFANDILRRKRRLMLATSDRRLWNCYCSWALSRP